MPQTPVLSRARLESLRCLDTCTVANAIETFNLRLRNEGFADSSLHCMFPNFPPMVGYAVTGRIRCSSPPMVRHSYYDRTDWWNYMLTIPAPRVLVVEDVDEHPGLGSFVGELHANLQLALGCVGYVTNGGVRDLPAVEQTRFQLFAGNVAVSHAFAHMIDFGEAVEVGGLKVQPGDLIHGDRHGVLSIPNEIAADIPAAAAKLLQVEREIIALCRSDEFSLEALRELVLTPGRGTP
jgi:4-hydroxy-4-methyl-2-oxoglutarate aldolase